MGEPLSRREVARDDARLCARLGVRMEGADLRMLDRFVEEGLLGRKARRAAAREAERAHAEHTPEKTLCLKLSEELYLYRDL